jgi:hypothetical protein
VGRVGDEAHESTPTPASRFSVRAKELT